MSLIIGEGEPGDRAALPLATRRGRHIANVKRIESPPARLRAAVEIIKKTGRVRIYVLQLQFIIVWD